MSDLTQFRIEITPVDPFFSDSITLTDQDNNDLLSSPYYISNDSGQEPSGGTLFISGNNTVTFIISATESSITEVCSSFGTDYGNIVMQVFGVYDDSTEKEWGEATTIEPGVTDCVALTNPCIIVTDLVVGQDYNIESADQTKTGVIRVTNKDVTNCNLCFYLMSGDWDTLDFNVDYDIKVFYGPDTALDFCILNPSPDPIWVDVLNDTLFQQGSFYFIYDTVEEYWYIDSQMDATWTASLETTAAGAPLEGPDVTGVRGTIEHSGSSSVLEVRLISDAGIVDSATLDFTAASSQDFEFLFSNPPALGSSLAIEVEHLSGGSYVGQFFLSTLEFLMLPSVQDQL